MGPRETCDRKVGFDKRAQVDGATVKKKIIKFVPEKRELHTLVFSY